MSDDEDDWIDEPIYFGVGSAETLQEIGPPRFRSVSPAAHRAFLIGRQAKAVAPMKGPLGFHRPRLVR